LHKRFRRAALLRRYARQFSLLVRGQLHFHSRAFYRARSSPQAQGCTPRPVASSNARKCRGVARTARFEPSPLDTLGQWRLTPPAPACRRAPSLPHGIALGTRQYGRLGFDYYCGMLPSVAQPPFPLHEFLPGSLPPPWPLQSF
jgi:hypothetical protein